MCSVSYLNAVFSATHNLKVLHCNIRSINKNIDSLLVLLSSHSFEYDIIALSETWLKPDEFINLPNFNSVNLSRPSKARGGGVALYINKRISFNHCPKLTCQTPEAHDFLFLELSSKLTVGVPYHSPSSHISLFLDALESVLEYFASMNKPAIICADLNIDTLNENGALYMNLIESYRFFNQIKQPTRVTPTAATLIGHILCNFDTSLAISGTIDTDISDHFPGFFLHLLRHSKKN